MWTELFFYAEVSPFQIVRNIEILRVFQGKLLLFLSNPGPDPELDKIE